MYDLEIKPEADKIFRKLSRKNPQQLNIINKKIIEIRETPTRDWKTLQSPLQNYSSVHIDKHFILIFRLDHVQKAVIILYYEHHDKAYDWRPKK